MDAPRPASEPRFNVEATWDVRVPARDGVELSANLWRPVTDAPVPVLLEMIPYGKDNWRRAADITRGEWFASRGYALCRLDVRGTGSSLTGRHRLADSSTPSRAAMRTSNAAWTANRASLAGRPVGVSTAGV